MQCHWMIMNGRRFNDYCGQNCFLVSSNALMVGLYYQRDGTICKPVANHVDRALSVLQSTIMEDNGKTRKKSIGPESGSGLQTIKIDNKSCSWSAQNWKSFARHLSLQCSPQFNSIDFSENFYRNCYLLIFSPPYINARIKSLPGLVFRAERAWCSPPHFHFLWFQL